MTETEEGEDDPPSKRPRTEAEWEDEEEEEEEDHHKKILTKAEANQAYVLLVRRVQERKRLQREQEPMTVQEAQAAYLQLRQQMLPSLQQTEDLPPDDE